MSLSQAASSALMIRPAAFGFNPESASSNAFQQAPSDDVASIQTQALIEFDALVAALRGAGVRVSVQGDTPEPVKPDAVFPNNWISFHSDGTVVLYPLQPASRRPERRRELIDTVATDTGFRLTRLVDLHDREQRGEFLEGTGSLVLDHQRRIAFACRSARTSDVLVERWCSLMGYEPMIFTATDRAGRPYYHTNVMLSIGSEWAVVAAEAIDSSARNTVVRALEMSGRAVLRVDRAAVEQFACNILELTGHDANGKAKPVVAMSRTAQVALQQAQVEGMIVEGKIVVAVPVPVIERSGGGSVRCMIAEVFAAR